MAGTGGYVRASSQCMLTTPRPRYSLTTQVFLILFAAMVYTATAHGFGMRMVDIRRTGGDLVKAMKANLAAN